MRVVVGVRGEHDLGIGGQLDLPELITQVGNRYAADFGVVFRRNRHFQGRYDRAVASDDFRAPLGEGDLVTGRRHAAGLVARRPNSVGARIAKENIRSPSVAGDILAPSCDSDIAPAAVSRSRRGQHYRVPAVREQMRPRRAIVRRDEPALRRRYRHAEFRSIVNALDPGPEYRYVIRHALLKQELRRLDDRFLVKTGAKRAVQKRV